MLIILKNDTFFIETFLICWLFILWNSRPHVISRLSLLQDLVKELDLLLRFSYLWNLCVSKYPEPSYIPLWEMRQKKLNFLKFWILELCCFKKSQFFKSIISEHFFTKISGNGPWVTRRNSCIGQGCSSTYKVVRLSNKRSF